MPWSGDRAMTGTNFDIVYCNNYYRTQSFVSVMSHGRSR